ncbi:MAG: hypothetical protein Q9195_007509 [Heterodermia aff. obscurata]
MVNSVDVAEYLKNATLEGSGLVPILECGAATGITGLVAAGIFGTLRSPNPAVFAAAKGTESFLLGSFFWWDNQLERKSIWQRTAGGKYSPMKVLSDEEYEKVLREKLVRVEAEIALIDEDIDKIQSQAEKLRRSS